MVELLGRDERRSGVRSARSESGERVAQQPRIRFAVMSAVEVDEPAELVDVLDRVLQRRLPPGKQRDGEEDPR
jgi:hypothetical protein